MDCSIFVAKIKALISYTIIEHLFAYMQKAGFLMTQLINVGVIFVI